MDIVWPEGTSQIIHDIIQEIGRDVSFYVASLSGCPDCTLDPVTNTSTDSFCPTCSGVYWLKTYTTYTTKAHVTWKYADDLEFTTGGYIFEGDGIIKIPYSGDWPSIADSSEFAVVEDKQVKLGRITLLGVPEINRVIIQFKEIEDDN